MTKLKSAVCARFGDIMHLFTMQPGFARYDMMWRVYINRVVLLSCVDVFRMECHVCFEGLQLYWGVAWSMPKMRCLFSTLLLSWNIATLHYKAQNIITPAVSLHDHSLSQDPAANREIPYEFLLAWKNDLLEMESSPANVAPIPNQDTSRHFC